jgi:hypothetical protein
MEARKFLLTAIPFCVCELGTENTVYLFSGFSEALKFSKKYQFANRTVKNKKHIQSSVIE